MIKSVKKGDKVKLPKGHYFICDACRLGKKSNSYHLALQNKN